LSEIPAKIAKSKIKFPVEFLLREKSPLLWKRDTIAINVESSKCEISKKMRTNDLQGIMHEIFDSQDISFNTEFYAGRYDFKSMGAEGSN
jgi:hypothetical protein